VLAEQLQYVEENPVRKQETSQLVISSDSAQSNSEAQKGVDLESNQSQFAEQLYREEEEIFAAR